MYFFIKPDQAKIQEIISQQSQQNFSYPELGATKNINKIPSHYNIDHYRIQLGSGSACFEKAKRAIKDWKMFDMDWLELCWPHAEIVTGSTVGILVRALGLWSLNVCRVVDVFDKQCQNEAGENIQKFGFAYGSLPEHAESGEERFMIEWNLTTDEVYYDIMAFSRPQQLLSKLGYFYVRRLQKAFGKASLQAMHRTIQV
ncbi:MAG: DUF1990 domain-containing protein [Deltaproteobacteria bacterium]|nr:DUF1990 domain-containing protein [Deltaproteobacteria bacterium]